MFSLMSFAQDGSLGFFGGIGYYNGELNPRNVFYMPSPAFGILYRHNFDNRWTLRLDVNTCNLRGDDANSTNTYQLERNHNFKTRIWEIGAQFEINFRKFDTDKIMSDYFSPYLTSGGYISIISDSQNRFEFAIPIGIGFKYALTKKIAVGMEWNYKWTNSDEIDKILPDRYIVPQQSHNPDNDWYSFFGAFITFQVFKEKSTCPAF